MRVLGLAVLLTGLVTQGAWACPGCIQPTEPTLGERLEIRDTVLLGRWIKGQIGSADEEEGGESVFEIVAVKQSGDPAVKVGQRVTVTPYSEGQPGELYLLMSKREEGNVKWDLPALITPAGWNYVKSVPLLGDENPDRLAYFTPFLEHADPLVADDAYAEFALAPFQQIAALKSQLPRTKLHQWIVSAETNPSRVSLYGIMLGICGQTEDVALLQGQALETSTELRLGLQGIIWGYLLLTGEQGLEKVVTAKIKPVWLTDKTGAVVRNARGEQVEFPFSETYSAVQAIGYMWSEAPGQIPKEKLRRSLHPLLDRVVMADLIITDLARWQDWSIMDRLMTMFDDPRYKIAEAGVKRAIIRYMLVAAAEKQENSQEPTPVAVKAAKNLELLEKKDPEAVEQAKRFSSFSWLVPPGLDGLVVGLGAENSGSLDE